MSVSALDALVTALRRLPGVGVKSAQRMAFHLLQHDREGAGALARALEHAVAGIRHCARCHTFTEAEVCAHLPRSASATGPCCAWSRRRPIRPRSSAAAVTAASISC